MPGPAATAMLVATRLANKLFCTVRIGLLPYVSAARQGARTGSLAVFVRTDRVVLAGLLGMRSDIDTTPAKLPTGRNSAFRSSAPRQAARRPAARPERSCGT